MTNLDSIFKSRVSKLPTKVRLVKAMVFPVERQNLKLKLQYSGHLGQRANSLEKTLMLGKTEDEQRRGRQDEMVGCHQRLSGHV